MTRPRIPASAITTSLPRPRTTCGMPAAAGELDERPQLERVVRDGEQVGRPADAHRREPGQRLVARRLDPDPALDLGPERDRVEGGAARSPAAVIAGVCRAPERRSIVAPVRAAAGARRPRGRARRRRRRQPAGRARGPRPPSGRGAPGRRGSPRRRAGPRRRMPRRRRAAPPRPRRAGGRSPAGGRRRAGTGTTTIGLPSAVTSARVELPARPTIRSAATSASAISAPRNGTGR